ncbi:MAG: outer membrane beta-barrel protein [Betaproteobacteria bacterium]|nr:outer membrane beta-barrel protein [Betaproteobacteria bacterium]
MNTPLRNQRPLALLLLAALIQASGALAQQVIQGQPLLPLEGAAGVQAEPLVLYPALTLGLGQNDNVGLASTDKLRSMYTSLSPALIAELRNGPQTFSAGYFGNYAWFKDSSADNYRDHQLSGAADLVFGSRIGLKLNTEYLKRHDPRGSTDRAISDTPDQWHASALAGEFRYGAKDAQGRVEVAAGLAQKRYDNNRDVTEFGDLNTGFFSGTFYYRVAPKTSLLFQASHTDLDYRSDAALLDNRERRYLTGVTWDVTAKTSGTVKLGLLQKDFKDASRTDFSGFSWEAAGRWSPLTYSHLDLTTSRAATDASGLGNYIVTRQFTARWTHDWSSRVTTEAGAALANDRYNGVERSDQRSNFGLKLRYKFQRWLRLGAEYDYARRDSSVDSYDYNRNLFMLTLGGTL